jgi:hypothetical protein
MRRAVLHHSALNYSRMVELHSGSTTEGRRRPAGGPPRLMLCSTVLLADGDSFTRRMFDRILAYLGISPHVVISAKSSSAYVPGAASAPAHPDPSARRLPIKATPSASLRVLLRSSLDVAPRLVASSGHEPGGADRADPAAWTRHR